MAIWALAGTLAFSFLLELIGASAANSSGWACLMTSMIWLATSRFSWSIYTMG